MNERIASGTEQKNVERIAAMMNLRTSELVGSDVWNEQVDRLLTGASISLSQMIYRYQNVGANVDPLLESWARVEDEIADRDARRAAHALAGPFDLCPASCSRCYPPIIVREDEIDFGTPPF